ncbi:MAG: EamA family transporter [Micromonosporaceae bacterium]|nr:EamA family transporter [Micromonosporaceae bacterium]
MISGVGPALCLLSAAFFGAMPIFGKFAYEAGVTPGTLLLVRFSLAGIVLTVLLLVRPSLRRTVRNPAALASPDSPVMSRRRVVVIAIGLGFLGYATQSRLYFSALQYIDASLLALILYTYPVLVTAGSVLLGRDRMTPGRAFALVTASGGTVLLLVGASAGSFHPFGAALAFGAAVVYTTYILVSDTVVRRLPPVVLSTLVMVGATTGLGAQALLLGGVSLDFEPSAWFWLACIAIVSTVMAVLTFFAGLRRTGPSTAAILSTFEPVVTTGLASLTLGEFLTGPQLVGGVLVLASVVVLQLRPARAKNQPAPTPDARAALDTPS